MWCGREIYHHAFAGWIHLLYSEARCYSDALPEGAPAKAAPLYVIVELP